MNFPLRHISIRVPWLDSGWNGTVCACPKRNAACLKLVNIAEHKDEPKIKCGVNPSQTSIHQLCPRA